MLLQTGAAGGGFSVITEVAGALGQPKASKAVTVYVVVDAGDTVTVAPVSAPGFHWYEATLALPVAVSVMAPPVQMVAAAGKTDTVGVGFTVTRTSSVPEQPSG